MANVKYNGKVYDVDTVNLIKHLKTMGFGECFKIEKICPTFKFKTNGLGDGAYVGKRFVVKSSYISGQEPPKNVKCPTYKIRNSEWVIQPKCKVFAELSERTKKKYLKEGKVEYTEDGVYYIVGGGSDGHDENFGLLKGKLKQFDW